MDEPPVIGVIGVGYVGLVTAACFARLGSEVVCRDIVEERVEGLRAGRVPFYEPGLADVVVEHADRLTFTTDIRDVTGRASIIFVCVNTPPMYSGDADLSFVEHVVEELPQDTGDVVLVMKSTVPVGTGARMQGLLEARGLGHVRYVSNPEFLKEGDALRDFMNPDRVVIGSDDERAIDRVAALHAPLDTTIVRTDVATAEMIKYASNAFLATKISFINEIANVCEETGADVATVAEGMGLDQRIGHHFLRAGIGFGGSCLVGTETVLVRESGAVRLCTLEELVAERTGTASTWIDGVHVTEVTDGLEVLSWTVDDEAPAFRRVSVLTRRSVESDVVEVRTKMGRRIACTADHPFVVRVETGEVVTKLAANLATTDFVPVALGHPDAAAGIEQDHDILDGMLDADLQTGDVIVRPRLGVIDELAVDDLAAQLQLVGARKQRVRAHEIRRTGAIRLSEIEEFGLDLMGASAKTARNGTLAPVRIGLDTSFWRVMGLYLAEGATSRDGSRERIAWHFHPTDEDHLADEIVEYWAQHGVKTMVDRGATSLRVAVSSRILAGWWIGVLGAGRSCYDHRIPDAIWTATDADRVALLSGLWEGDGSWSLVNRGPSVVLEYGTVSPLLADGIVRLLAGFGIVARVKVGRTAKSTVDTWWLVVSGGDQVERLLDIVPESQRSGVVESLSQTRRIAPTGYRRDGTGTAWVRVTDVIPSSYRGDVFSLEVPEAHTFVTTGSLVVHNCFPKDVTALKQLAGNSGYHFQLLNAVIEVNELQKRRLVGKLVKHLGNLRGRTIALLGLAFKPGTDDMREAASLVLSSRLAAEGAAVRGYDPVANDAARRVLVGVDVYDDPVAMLEGVDAAVLVTEWPEFAQLDLAHAASIMRTPLLVDGRNLFDPEAVAAAGLTYEGVGRPGASSGTPRRRSEDGSGARGDRDGISR